MTLTHFQSLIVFTDWLHFPPSLQPLFSGSMTPFTSSASSSGKVTDIPSETDSQSACTLATGRSTTLTLKFQKHWSVDICTLCFLLISFRGIRKRVALILAMAPCRIYKRKREVPNDSFVWHSEVLWQQRKHLHLNFSLIIKGFLTPLYISSCLFFWLQD